MLSHRCKRIENSRADNHCKMMLLWFSQIVLTQLFEMDIKMNAIPTAWKYLSFL